MSDSILLLDPDRLSVSESNVRITANPAFASIKASIKADHGKSLVLTVSRPSDDDDWEVVHGGGTRLLAVQQLKSELRSSSDVSQFEQVRCLPVPWECLLHAQIAGLRENQARGNTSYAEDCLALLKIRQEWLVSESVNDTDNTDKHFLDYMKTQGVTLSSSHYARMRICAELYLPCLEKWAFKGRASAAHVKDLISHRAAITRLMSHPPEWLNMSLAMTSTEAKAFYDNHFASLAQSTDAKDMSHQKLMSATTRRVAKALSIPPQTFKSALKGKEPRENLPSVVDTVRQQIEQNDSDPEWSNIARTFGVENNFKGALYALVSLPADQLTSLVKTIRPALSATDRVSP